MKAFATEIVITVVVIVMIVLLLNPWQWWMPDTLAYLMTAGLLLVVGLFVFVVWKEQPTDEREELHSMFGSRVGYVVAVGVLLLGVIVQLLQDVPLDPWLLYALGGAVLGKIVARLYLHRHQ